MLEIIALIFFTRKIGTLADQKGVKAGPWKLYTVLAWFAGEIGGAIIGVLLFNEVAPAIVLGLALAISSFFIVRSILAKRPDSMDDEIEQIGQAQA